MNFRELVDDLAMTTGTREVDLLVPSSSAPLDYDDTHARDLMRWIQRAWRSIQLQSNWRFMTVEGSAEVTEANPSYDLRADPDTSAPDFRYMQPYTNPLGRKWIVVHKTPDERGDYCTFVRYSRWAGAADILRIRKGRPRNFTIDPQDNLLVLPEPDDDYTLTFDYIRKPQELVDETDVPILPEEFHDIIVYRALIKYAGYDEAAAQYQRAQPEYKELLTRLRYEQLPPIRVSGSSGKVGGFYPRGIR